MRFGPPPDQRHLDWRGELNFPEAYGEELEVLGPLKVGADIGSRFHIP